MNNILIMRSVANVEQNHTYIKINLLVLLIILVNTILV